MLYTIQNKPKLTHDYINQYVSDYDIYCYYIGNRFIINKTFNSPLREDNNPSFGIVESQDGHLLYHDFATGDRGNAITFVKNKNNLNSFKEALERIYEDLVVKGLRIPEETLKPLREPKKALKKDIGVQRRKLTQVDIDYWKQFGITETTLKEFEVDPIEYLIVNDYVYWKYEDNSPMYVYKVYDKLKIYRPLSDKKHKWHGNLTKNYVFGYKQLPESGDLLIITKSLKDVMCLKELGYYAISPSSEGVLLPKKCIDDIRKRFKQIIVLYDNDLPGLKAAQRMFEKYQIHYVMIPNKYEEKDLTDFIVRYGKNKTITLLRELLI